MLQEVDWNSIYMSSWLFCALLGVGLNIKWSDFLEFKHYKKDLAKVIILNYLLLPSILLLIAYSLNWTEDHSIFGVFFMPNYSRVSYLINIIGFPKKRHYFQYSFHSTFNLLYCYPHSLMATHRK